MAGHRTSIARSALAGLVCWLLFPGMWVPHYANSGDQGNRQSDPGSDVFFAQQVAPILIRQCLPCHGSGEPAGGLNLSSRDTALAGGESGSAIQLSNPDGSYLIQRVREPSMPPPEHGPPLDADQIEVLASWIRAGASWPKDRVLSVLELTTDRRAGTDWWSLQPVRRPPVPSLEASSANGNPIDAFVLARLREHRLHPSAEASRQVLIRRATFDLLGLPPTPQEVGQFANDRRPDAYERLIERLLDSPHYGERWARHWLDVVRFGETNGYETNTPRPRAWPYRDYVIDALNQDKPYSQFVVEQLAGDTLGVDAATGFLVGGPHDVVAIQNTEGQRQQRADDLDDMINTTTTAFLGVTVGCARCHDHKFDPITQRDYYGLQAVFAGVLHGEREVKSADYAQRVEQEKSIRSQLARWDYELSQLEPLATTQLASAGRRAPVHALGNVDRFQPVEARFVRFTVSATNNLEPCIDELQVFDCSNQPVNVAAASQGAQASCSGTYADGSTEIHQLRHINDQLFGNSRSWISNQLGGGWVQIEFPQPVVIDRVVWARDRQGVYQDRLATEYVIEVATDPAHWQVVATGADRQPYRADAERVFGKGQAATPEQRRQLAELLRQREQLAARLPEAALTTVYCGTFTEPEPTYLLDRGDVMQPRYAVAPGTPAALGSVLSLDAATPEATRRMELARWIASEHNPLTARVIVNRLWHYHFGRGLVATPSNFGFHGGEPSHPQLLDWLADELVAGNWRLKHLHRLIMCSQTYRQASDADERAMRVDAENRWLWRYPLRRLEAEPIRDAILAVSGALDRQMGGPGYDPFEPDTNYVHVFRPRQTWGPEQWRRMIYQTKPRMEQDSTFGVFDCPDASQIAPRRTVSATVLQALSLLNSPFVVQQAELFAERLQQERPADVTAQIDLGFQLALGRSPDEDELRGSVNLVAKYGLSALCRALFNSSEFIYLQ